IWPTSWAQQLSRRVRATLRHTSHRCPGSLVTRSNTLRPAKMLLPLPPPPFSTKNRCLSKKRGRKVSLLVSFRPLYHSRASSCRSWFMVLWQLPLPLLPQFLEQGQLLLGGEG